MRESAAAFFRRQKVRQTRSMTGRRTRSPETSGVETGGGVTKNHGRPAGDAAEAKKGGFGWKCFFWRAVWGKFFIPVHVAKVAKMILIIRKIVLSLFLEIRKKRKIRTRLGDVAAAWASTIIFSGHQKAGQFARNVRPFAR